MEPLTAQSGVTAQPWVAACSWSLAPVWLPRRNKFGISHSLGARVSQEQLGPLAPRLCTPARPGEGQQQLLRPRGAGRWRGRGHPRGIGLGFQQPFSTRLLEACMGASGCLQHPLTLSFTLSLSSQLAARREKQNRLFLRDWSKAEREAGCGTSRAGHGAEAEPCPGTPTRRTVQDL